MNRKEIKRVDYSCGFLEKRVHLTLEYLHHGTGFNWLTTFDCDGCRNCGVGREERPDNWTFDWSKCVHPAMSKK